jgi:uncharacterized protein (DUF342 family)
MELWEQFQFLMDEDKIYLTLVYRGPPIDTIHEENILSILRTKGIKYGLQKEAIYNIINTLKEKSNSIVSIKEIIAKGLPPEPSKDGSYQLLINLEPKIPTKEDGSIDLKNIEYYKIVSPNQKIIILYPPYKGKNGINIFGEEIPSKEPLPIPIKTGNNINLIKQQDGSLLGISKIYGIITLKENVLDISPDLLIEEDASIEKGNLRFKNNIYIKKNLLRGLEVYTEKDLIVEGNIESGKLRILGNLICKGGINTAFTGTIICKHKIQTSFIENTHIICDNDLIVKNSILNSQIICHGSIIINSEKGSIIGGKITFYESLNCKILGNISGIKTEIYVGYHHNNIHILETLESEFKKIEKEIQLLTEELKYYKKLIDNKHNITDNTKKIIQNKIESYKKQNEIYLKKKSAIEYLKKNSYNPKEIILIPHIVYPGVHFFYFNKTFPIEETLKPQKLVFDPATKSLKIL